MNSSTPSTEIISEHGVFLVINQLGVLIRGQAGIGKSTLALELLHYGHQLVADDVVEFKRQSADNRYTAQCPEMLKGLLAVRDLGILKITDLFHKECLCENYPLQLIIDLVDSQAAPVADPFHPYPEIDFYHQPVASQRIFAHQNRNLAIIVETTVKNYILYRTGNDASQQLIQRQQQYLL